LEKFQIDAIQITSQQSFLASFQEYMIENNWNQNIFKSGNKLSILYKNRKIDALITD